MKTHTLIGIIIILAQLIITACSVQETDACGRIVTDVLGRDVQMPDTVGRVVCVMPGTLHIVSMIADPDDIVGVEDMERLHDDYIHNAAYPELKDKPIIGPRMGGDSEQILTAEPDVIFCNSVTAGEAKAMQRKTGTPVVALEDGDMNRQRGRLYESFDVIGRVLGKGARADSLKQFIEAQIEELKRYRGRCAKRAYVGGISYKGAHDITSTDPYYAAFDYVGLKNVARIGELSKAKTITNIDMEQLLEWNPEYVFVDKNGEQLVRMNMRVQEEMKHVLRAWQEMKTFLLWPYNHYHSNFEVMLINAWAIVERLYPNEVDVREKADEILKAFYGKNIYDKLEKIWGRPGARFVE